ncbi:hypothetical protein SCE1572_25870 [Sorangium cellulosum So0157-2]|uniref:Uncharacterized protein n=1 Tax=Sorangium cellulosum So0157-2 TaxID=1254432 RepID=S4XYQ3_SORCE|nr:hypothetical protein SCE1572_25870 [Sorangium cellulosum So0157-2]
MPDCGFPSSAAFCGGFTDGTRTGGGTTGGSALVGAGGTGLFDGRAGAVTGGSTDCRECGGTTGGRVPGLTEGGIGGGSEPGLVPFTGTGGGSEPGLVPFADTGGGGSSGEAIPPGSVTAGAGGGGTAGTLGGGGTAAPTRVRWRVGGEGGTSAGLVARDDFLASPSKTSRSLPPLLSAMFENSSGHAAPFAAASEKRSRLRRAMSVMWKSGPSSRASSESPARP